MYISKGHRVFVVTFVLCRKMKKNNLKQEIFLLILVASFASANFFALAAIDTSKSEDGSVNFKSSSTNYQFDAEVGAPAVGRSTSSNYILDHGAYWEQYSPSAPKVETSGGGGGGQMTYPNSGSQIVSTPTSNASTTKVVTKFIKNDCNSEINCNSIAIIREIYFITEYVINQSNPFIDSNNASETSTNIIPRNIIYLLISLLLILIIIILYITFKRIKRRLNQVSIESKNKYD